MLLEVTALAALLAFVVFIGVYSTMRFEKYPEGINIMVMSLAGVVITAGLFTRIEVIAAIGWLVATGSMVHRTYLVLRAKKVLRRALAKEMGNG